MKKVEKLAQEIRNLITDGTFTLGRMEDVLEKHVPVQKPFPKLMRYKGSSLTVLVAENGVTCAVIRSGCGHKVGDIYDWNDNDGTEPISNGYEDCEIEVLS